MALTPTQQTRAMAELFAEYIKEKRILIADPTGSARASMANILVKMGAKTSNIALVPNYTAAEEEIGRSHPKVVIADYDLGKRCGLDLLQRQRSQLPDMKDALFVLVTGNTSQSAVAKAAEEDVDTYIIKPFTAEVFRDCIVRATSRKVEPSEYQQVIARGKLELSEGKIDESIKTFDYARTLDSSPALALYYLGQAQDIKKLVEQAEGDYNKGLGFNKIHYKCLVGLYENLMKRKKHGDAYDVIKRISHYFPANPQRMSAVLRLAIVTQSYEDVERYYRIFTSIDERNDEMVKYVCAALVVCGKYYLQQGHNSRALELFQKAGITAAGRTRILREIIQALVECGMSKQAEEFLKRFPPETQKSTDYVAMDLLVMNDQAGASRVVERGRTLLAEGHHDAVIYRIMIARSAQANLTHAAEDLLREACTRYPEQKDSFNRALVNKENAPKSAPVNKSAPNAASGGGAATPPAAKPTK